MTNPLTVIILCSNRHSMANDPEMTFEATLDRLQKIVQNLESGESPLEDSLKLFEEGVGLTRKCQEKLILAEKRVEILAKTPETGDQGPQFKPFGTNSSSGSSKA